METNSLGFIGGGRITNIFLQAFTNKNADLESVVVFDNDTDVLTTLKEKFPIVEIARTLKQVVQQPILFIALHPPIIIETLDKISEAVSVDTCVISLAPKITIEKISSRLRTKKIVRIIPNATSFINEGYNPMTFANDFNHSEKIQVTDMLKLLGNSFEVAEPKLEAYAILSAMLPTYFWFQWKELANIGRQMGLSEAESSQSVHATLKAALSLYFESGLAPETVMDLIPVKPIGENEPLISEIYRSKLMGLFERIRA